MSKPLLELAREATPGPWTVTDNSWKVSTIYGSDRKAIAECHIDPEVTEYNQATLEKITTANAAFIAAANPQRIIELCEALEPFARFFKSDNHDLSVAQDHTIVATFLGEDKLPLAELTIADFRRARRALKGE